jgi:plastocyanin
MRFTPAEITVRQGETVRFALRNAGRLKHELVLGTEQALKAHDAAMARDPAMEHADPNMLTLAPGARGEIVWRFTRSGRVDFACLQPGHYAAGMKGLVRVSAGPADAAELDRPRSGEKVRFQAGKVDGRFDVTRIESAASPASSSR